MTSKRLTALVADDDPAARLILVSLLQEEGFETWEAGEGLHALQHLQERRFDLLTLDLVMPDLDGVGVLQCLRAVSPGTVVLVISGALGYSLPSLIEFFRVDAVLRKPIDPEELRQAVRGLVSPGR